MKGCTYVTVLDRECGREATTGEYCDFHALLSQFDRDESVITVPKSQRDTVARIVSDVLANFDVMPLRRWEDNPAIYLNMTGASMRRHEALRQMRIYPERYGE